MTPEGEVKKTVNRELNKRKQQGVHWHMPVQNGMGKPTLDYTGCVRGKYFAIETKARGGKPTPRQEATAHEIVAAGGIAFLIDDDMSLLLFTTWLDEVLRDNPQAYEVCAAHRGRPESSFVYPTLAVAAVQR